MIQMTSLEIAKFWQYTEIDKSTKMIRDARKWYGHCWNWKGHKKKGYGYFSLHQIAYRAHRISYQIIYGEIPCGILVCHKCDNPSCVNPQHLFLGTSKENTRDMISKGRLNPSRGENRGVSYRKETGKWRARYMRGYKNILVGEFDSHDEALQQLKIARASL
jgi:hypothetical protein